ncbi:hypothetical protein Pla52n_49970 [Stieleria varia]|uniref:Uncharacterized protein n=1 Tax=Stieleria varia TaxID=2528005 RepID=A0A5C6AJV5_9BACT|nr:hypothetical protein Pla52n_49970 [Stieleria varia]
MMTSEAGKADRLSRQNRYPVDRFSINLGMPTAVNRSETRSVLISNRSRLAFGSVSASKSLLLTTGSGEAKTLAHLLHLGTLMLDELTRAVTT